MPSEQSTHSAMQQAVDMARRAGQTVWFRVSRPLPDVDPWDVADSTGPHVWLHDDSQQVTFAAWAPITEWTLPLDERLVVEINAARDRMVDATPAGLPWITGGFAFSSAPLPASFTTPWHDWPHAWVMLPKFILYRDGHSANSLAIMTLGVNPGDSVRDLECAVESALEILLRRRTHAPMVCPATIGHDTPAAERDAWIARAQAARDAIRQPHGPRKIVLARSSRFCAPVHQPFDPQATARRLRRQQPNCAVFVIRPPRTPSQFVGATPELLVRVAGSTVSTVALAGTRPRHADPVADAEEAAALLTSPKDREEHRHVIAALRDTLSHVCHTVDMAPSPTIAPFATVYHLATPLAGTLAAPRHILDLVRHVHPTPAVGGTPRNTALQWLRDHESIDRGWYAGPVGWFDTAGHGAFFVAIRCALLRDSVATAFAGAGIVATSDPGAEWAETALKFRSLAEALAVAPPPTVETTP